MSVIDNLIRNEENGAVSFGNYELSEKTKVSDFAGKDGNYKVKTFKEMTRLEVNDIFLYESEPGTAVFNFMNTDNDVSFEVETPEDAQVTVAAEPDTYYTIRINGEEVDEVKASLGGKLSFSISPSEGSRIKVELTKA